MSAVSIACFATSLNVLSSSTFTSTVSHSSLAAVLELYMLGGWGWAQSIQSEVSSPTAVSTAPRTASRTVPLASSREFQPFSNWISAKVSSRSPSDRACPP